MAELLYLITLSCTRVPIKVSTEGILITEAAQMLLNDHRNITATLQAAVCLCDPLPLSRLHIATSHFDHEGDSTL